MPNSKSIRALKRKLDKVFSQYIRRREADFRGMASCFTCKKKFHWKKLQCGHFAPRQHNSTRYSEKNCHPQCYACNVLYGGQPDQYAVELKKKYGEGIIEELNNLRHQVKKWKPKELEGLIKEYQNKLNEVVSQTDPGKGA